MRGHAYPRWYDTLGRRIPLELIIFYQHLKLLLLRALLDS